MSLGWKWFVGFVMGGRGVTHGDNDGPLKCMWFYCGWRAPCFMVTCLIHTCTHTYTDTHWHMRANMQDPLHTSICSNTDTYSTQAAYESIIATARTLGRYNMINGGVSVTLINYNQIKDFIRPNLGSTFGHTVNHSTVIFTLHDFFFFLTLIPKVNES